MRGKIFIVGLMLAAVARGGTLTWTAPAPGRTDGRCYWYVPDGLATNRPMPLLVFLHGGDASTPDTAPANYLDPQKGGLMPELARAPFVIAAPSAPPAPDGSRWNRAGVSKYVQATIAAAAKKFPIDRDRIFLGGHSMGCYGAWQQGQLLADQLAGVWCSAGAWWKADFRNFLGTPVYVQHGTWDCAFAYRGPIDCPRHHDWCGVDFARAADRLMTRDGVAHVFDEHAGGHSLAWEPARAATRRFLAWTIGKRRQPYAPHVCVTTPCGTWHPEVETHLRSRWLEIVRTKPGTIAFDTIVLDGPQEAWTLDELRAQTYELKKGYAEGARLEAWKLGGNEFRVRAENVTAFRICVAAAMGDLGKPFRVAAGALGTRTLAAEKLEGNPDYPAALTWK